MKQSEFHGGDLRSVRGVSLSPVQDKVSTPDEYSPVSAD